MDSSIEYLHSLIYYLVFSAHQILMHHLIIQFMFVSLYAGKGKLSPSVDNSYQINDNANHSPVNF
jgi:hypothetical protein